jgi:hypothetical protein
MGVDVSKLNWPSSASMRLRFRGRRPTTGNV